MSKLFFVIESGISVLSVISDIYEIYVSMIFSLTLDAAKIVHCIVCDSHEWQEKIYVSLLVGEICLDCWERAKIYRSSLGDATQVTRVGNLGIR